MDNILEEVQTFLHSKQFWYWHGFVLSVLWVLVSAIGILAKRFNTKVHVLLFIIVDFTTVFFAGFALYRVSSGFSNFIEWSPLKQGHVVGGKLNII